MSNSMWIHIFFLVFLTTLTGTCTQLLWLLARKLCGYKNPMAIYAGLRFVCLSYVVPAAYLLSYRYFHNSFFAVNHGDNIAKMLQLTPFFKDVLSVLAVIWLCLFLLILCFRVTQHLRWRQLIPWEHKEGDAEVLEKLAECCRRLHIRRMPKVYRKKDLPTPLCSGLFTKIVMLPEREFSPEELEIIFMHELTHIRKHDLEMKWMSVFITMIHCFNPMAYFLFRQISIWSEIRCDILACEKSVGVFTTKKYFHVIFEMMLNNNGRSFKDFILTALAEKSSTIVERLRYVINYKKTEKRKRIMASIVMAAVLVIGSVVSYAAGATIMGHYDQFVKNRFSMGIEHLSGQDEEIIPDVDKRWNFTRIVDHGSGSKEKMGYEYRWKLGSLDAYEIKQIYCEAGNVVKIHCLLEDGSDKYAMAGIIGSDRTARIVKKQNAVLHSFDIDESGYYSVFAGNINDSDIEVNVKYYLVNGE